MGGIKAGSWKHSRKSEQAPVGGKKRQAQEEESMDIVGNEKLHQKLRYEVQAQEGLG